MMILGKSLPASTQRDSNRFFFSFLFIGSYAPYLFWDVKKAFTTIVTS